MTVQMISDFSVLVGGIQVAGKAKNVTASVDVATLDTTPISTTGWVECIGGKRSSALGFDFMNDYAPADINDTLYSYLGTATIPKSVCVGSADGSLAYLVRGLPHHYETLQGQPGDLAMGRYDFAGSGRMVRGIVLHPPGTARTSSASGAARQQGAIGATQTGYAALHVLSVAGTATPTVTVKVQSDDNSGFSSATDRITFTGATAVGYQWGTVAGAVTDDYWRVVWTISGTNPSFLFAVTFGIT